DEAETLRRVKEWRAEYNRRYQEKRRRSESDEDEIAQDEIAQVDADEERDWKDVLLDRLMKLTPDAFERLAQRLLREAGFRNVQVLGRSGDGGIDGVGVCTACRSSRSPSTSSASAGRTRW